MNTFLASTVTGCIFISECASSVGIPVGVTGPATKLLICEITAGIEKYKSIIKKKKNDKVVLLARVNSGK